MTLLPIIYGIAAGICLYASLYHLLVGLRQRPFSHIHLSFSLMTIIITGMILCDAAYRLATTLDAVYWALDIGITLTAFALIVFLWFVSNYTGVRPTLFLWIMTVGLAVMGIVNLILPGGVLYSEITGFQIVSMPWGETFAILEGVPSNLQLINIILFLLTFGFCFFGIFKQYKHKQHRQALFLLLGISPIIFGTVFDFLLDFGIVTNFIGLYPMSYVGLVIIMSLVMSDEVVKGSILQKEVAENERRMRSLLENVEMVVVGLDDEGCVNYTNPFYSKITGFNKEEVFGKDFIREFVPSRKYVELQTTFTDLLVSDRNRYYQNPILTKDGDERIISWANVRLRDKENQIIGTLSIGTDITNQLKATETLQTQAKELEQYREKLEGLVDERTTDLSQAVTELNTLNHIARAVATLVGLQTILQSVCAIVAPLFDAAVVVINVLEDDRKAVHLMAGYDRDAHNATAPNVGQTIPLESTKMMMQVLTSEKPFTASGLHSQTETVSEILQKRNIDALLIVPLRSRGEIIGMLGILRDETGTTFDAADISLAETIGGYVAGAIENDQLKQQLAETAVAEERSRIARELHDSVTQNLYTVATISDAIPDLWDTHPDETREALENLRRLSRGALAEMRILLLELRPSALLEKPLGQLLQQLSESVEGRSRIQVTTTITGNQSFPDHVQIALYRIAQEALNNVIKHSEATQVTIGLYQIAGTATLSVRDNGVGFDVKTAVNSGFGLENMQERAQQINAKLSVESMPEKGTEISIIWQTADEDDHE